MFSKWYELMNKNDTPRDRKQLFYPNPTSKKAIKKDSIGFSPGIMTFPCGIYMNSI